MTPFHTALWSGHKLELIQPIVDARGDVEARTEIERNTVFHIIVEIYALPHVETQNKSDVIEYFMKQGGVQNNLDFVLCVRHVAKIVLDYLFKQLS